MKMTSAKYLAMLLAAMLVVGCSGTFVGMPSWYALQYQSTPTYGNLHGLATAYGETINAALKADTLHPGMYADLGVAMALMGQDAEASRMLNAEMRTFPESREMVMALKARLLPAYLTDTLATWRGDSADLALLQRIAYDSVAALRYLPFVAPVIDSTDTARVLKQTPIDSLPQPIKLTANQKRIRLEQEQAKAARMQKAAEDSIAAAKQAKIDARKQAKADKKKAKKEQDKARKQAQKEREQAMKEKKKQRDLEKQRRAEERKSAKKQ